MRDWPLGCNESGPSRFTGFEASSASGPTASLLLSGVEVVVTAMLEGDAVSCGDEFPPRVTTSKIMMVLTAASTVSRRRWPATANPAPLVGVPPPKKKADGTVPAAH